jgi:hypothetical protein
MIMAMKDAWIETPANEVDEILGILQDGLEKTEQAMVSLLQGMLTDSTLLLCELEAALTDAEAALLND